MTRQRMLDRGLARTLRMRVSGRSVFPCRLSWRPALRRIAQDHEGRAVFGNPAMANAVAVPIFIVVKPGEHVGGITQERIARHTDPSVGEAKIEVAVHARQKSTTSVKQALTARSLAGRENQVILMRL